MHLRLKLFNFLFCLNDVVLIALLLKLVQACLLRLQILFMIKVCCHDWALLIVVLGELNIGQLVLAVQEVVGHERVLALTLLLQYLLKLQPKSHPENIVIEVKELIWRHVAKHVAELGDRERFRVVPLEIVFLLLRQSLVKAHQDARAQYVDQYNRRHESRLSCPCRCFELSNATRDDNNVVSTVVSYHHKCLLVIAEVGRALVSLAESILHGVVLLKGGVSCLVAIFIGCYAFCKSIVVNFLAM